MGRRKKSSCSDILYLMFFVIAFMAFVSQCNNKSSVLYRVTPTKDPSKTFEPFIETTPPPTEMSPYDRMSATHHAWAAEVQKTVERQFIERTMTEIVERTIRPTMYHMETVDKMKTQIVQHETMVVLMTELADN